MFALEKKPLTEALTAAALVTAVVGGGALVVPKRYVATFVAIVFLLATWRLVWTKDDETVTRFGVQLGGLMLHEHVSRGAIVRAGLRATAWGLALAAVIFVPYFFAWRVWWHPRHAFAFDFHPLDFGNDVLGQLLLVALPEEAFYRGYLQTRLDDALGKKMIPAVLVTSIIFALGHYVTIPAPTRLAVFFPSLAFGFLRARTRGIGAPLAFHAFCNIFSEMLGRAFGVY